MEGMPRMRVAIVEDNVEDQQALGALFSRGARGRKWTYTTETYPSGVAFLAAGG